MGGSSCPNEDDVVLSYFDALVTVKDVSSLRHRSWLTDNIINFFIEYLDRTILQMQVRSSVIGKSIAVVGPSVVQMLKFFHSGDFSVLECLELPSKYLILLPLNDADTDDHGIFLSCSITVQKQY